MNRIATAAVGIALLAGTATGCSHKPNEAKVRQSLHDQLVKSGRSDKQATCIVDKLDTNIVKGLSDGKAPKIDTPAFEHYSKSLADCIKVK